MFLPLVWRHCSHVLICVMPGSTEDCRLFEKHGKMLEVALIKDGKTGQQQGICDLDIPRLLYFLRILFQIFIGYGLVEDVYFMKRKNNRGVVLKNQGLQIDAVVLSPPSKL
ncbi:hypothetical protein K1719_005728 [Acacia pycnantha]|nr:hypothetical protein K1719_005728 [Acacia pycnantha]